ncbi:MAG: 4-(cytidine 5'-diphospho)-2-C-methyl-D-erythritol kinase [Actinomycetota bacterium]|nr:4-(cytidine 5'-diphospho)-2-C-methyl-D-erythritol kinase [Actinomycetota bacterium]MDP3629791.1 4-(cytidine 5'-diphospho)-2-C-methyl-D-erythritol kinase [Actinomycetota bacterium]
MLTDHVTLISPGKVNLFLEVGARRTDGYHDVATVLQALDERAADVVEMAPADALAVTCVPDIGVSAEDNLATRALVLLGEVAGRTPAFAVTLRKRLPAAAGLGGASSNAAAVLVGACRLWGLDPASGEVLGIARSLGADVPFFIEGGTALYTGRGDVLARRLPTNALSLVLINPGEPVSTAAAYAHFDRRLRGPARDVTTMLEALQSGDSSAVASALANNLGDVAVEIAPSVGEARSFLRQAPGVLGALVAGSGSTVFGICEDQTSAEDVAREASTREGWWSVATCASSTGVRFVTPEGR